MISGLNNIKIRVIAYLQFAETILKILITMWFLITQNQRMEGEG